MLKNWQKKHIKQITVSDWQKKFANAIKVEQGFIGQQETVEHAVESFIIDLGADSSDDEDTPDTSNMSDGFISGVEDLN